jgi:Probable sensor domain DACNG/Probable sensor domain DACNH/DisA bacterial checkpoint controller nucleotide-binding
MNPTPDTINLFMWGYQSHFRISLTILAEQTLTDIAPDLQPRALLIGIRNDNTPGHHVCIEPEDGPYDVTLFTNIDDDIANIASKDPEQNMYYGDAPSMNMKPIWIRQRAIKTAIRNRLRTTDDANDTFTFAGNPTPVEHYDVVPILQVNRTALNFYPRLTKNRDGRWPLEYSFPHAIIKALLSEATADLQKTNPGSSLSGTLNRDPTDIRREAGKALMRTPSTATLMHGDLFAAANFISSLYHERAESKGTLIIARPGHPAVTMILEFTTPIPLAQSHWARKALQLTTPTHALVTDSRSILGLGTINATYDPSTESVFTIDITGHNRWDLFHNATILLRTTDGIPSLPKKPISEDHFRSHATRRLGSITHEQLSALWKNIEHATTQLHHGTTIVITTDAATEAARLATTATPITPCTMTPDLLPAASHIDGALILDPSSTCHAIGVILDGKATTKGTPSRGARYNAAIRYTEEHQRSLAIVISDDGTTDLIPKLRPQVNRSTIEEGFIALRRVIAKRDLKNALAARNWLDNYRFYLNADQCREANDALVILEDVIMKANRIWIVTNPFTPHPEMNDTYFLTENPSADDAGAPARKARPTP